MDSDPFARFSNWFEQAQREEPADHDAAALATVSSTGMPSLRMVLVRGFDKLGFVFYTNLASRKALELTQNPHAAICFHWKSTERQVRIEGGVQPVNDDEADAYFASRPRESQIGAWASRQSQVLDGWQTLTTQVEHYEAQFAEGEVPRPRFWSGFRLSPVCFEFWDKRPHRLHERMLFRLSEGVWVNEQLYP